MKYVRNFEDFKKYSFEFFDSFLPPDLSEKMVNNFLLDLGDAYELEKQTLSYIKFQPLDYQEVADYGEAILQLNDYKDLLKKFVELLLKSNSYEALCKFISRIFVSEIGDIKYHSCQKDYTIDERYFDRFVEISQYCNIDKSLTTPFYISILNSDNTSSMFVYKEPLKEYLDVYLNDDNLDDEFIMSLISTDTQSSINTVTMTSNKKTIKMLLTEYAEGDFTSSQIVKKILLKNKQEGFNIIEDLLKSEEYSVKFRAVQMLCFLKEDRRVYDRLKFIYQHSNDTKLRGYLEKECGFTSLLPFESKEAFEQYVNSSVQDIQERLFGARLRRYYEEYNLDNTGFNGKVLTFVMDFFKNKDIDNQLSRAKEYFKFVDRDILSKLARVVFTVATHRDRLSGSKWSLRLIAVFGDESLIEDMLSILREWSNSQTKNVYVKYFVSLLSLAKRGEIIKVVRELKKLDLSKKQVKFLDDILLNFSKYTNQNIEQVVFSLKDKGLVDEIIEYKPNAKINLQKNEITKRNIGLKYAKKAGVNYFMTMDTDEFYIKEELDKAQEFIIENNITHSFCPIINYGLTPFQRSKEIAQYSVPFFFKVTKHNFLRNEKKRRICISDPTRNSSYYLFARYFYLNNITMHHMSYIRKDLIKKLESSTANFNDETIKNILESLNNNNNFFETDNIFNITVP